VARDAIWKSIAQRTGAAERADRVPQVGPAFSRSNRIASSVVMIERAEQRHKRPLSAAALKRIDHVDYRSSLLAVSHKIH